MTRHAATLFYNNQREKLGVYPVTVKIVIGNARNGTRVYVRTQSGFFTHNASAAENRNRKTSKRTQERCRHSRVLFSCELNKKKHTYLRRETIRIVRRPAPHIITLWHKRDTRPLNGIRYRIFMHITVTLRTRCYAFHLKVSIHFYYQIDNELCAVFFSNAPNNEVRVCAGVLFIIYYYYNIITEYVLRYVCVRYGYGW